jgi:hypothetical protein
LGCSGCHSCPSYKAIDPYKVGGKSLDAVDTPGPVDAAHYLAGGTPFPGRGHQGSTLVAPNLTPDSSGLPGGLTYNEFKNAMQNGETLSKPGYVLQVMPWPAFRKMHEIDLFAMYQYLSAIPPARPGVCKGAEETGN